MCLNNSFGDLGNGYKNFIWMTKTYYENLTEEEISIYKEKYKNYDFESQKIKNVKEGHIKNKVVQLTLDIKLVKVWDSAYEPKIQGFEFYSSSIRRCCNHETKSYKGFVWMYESEYLELQNDDYIAV